jgi:hypothetical protein
MKTHMPDAPDVPPVNAATHSIQSTGVDENPSPSTPASDPATEQAIVQVTNAEAAELGLDMDQRLALTSLRKDRDMTKAAAAARVSRQTLWRWLTRDPKFQAAYNAWQQDLIDTGKAELLAGTRDALQTVLRKIREGDAKLAWKLLESQGLTARPNPGSTDIQRVAEDQAIEQVKESIQRRRTQAKLTSAAALADVAEFDEPL